MTEIHTSTQTWQLKARLDHLEQQLEILLAGRYVSYSASMSRGLPPEIVEAARSGRKIVAVDLYRKYAGVGLAEAKAFIDSL